MQQSNSSRSYQAAHATGDQCHKLQLFKQLMKQVTDAIDNRALEATTIEQLMPQGDQCNMAAHATAHAAFSRQ
jgi:hypothetical protein